MVVEIESMQKKKIILLKQEKIIKHQIILLCAELEQLQDDIRMLEQMILYQKNKLGG